MSQNAAKHSGKAAIVFEGRSLSWQDLWLEVQTISAGLEEHLEADQQQVVSILLPNSIEFVVAYLAIVHLGHIAFPLDPAFKQLELDAIIDEIDSKILISDDNYRSRIGPHKIKILAVADLAKHGSKPKSTLRLPADKQIASLTFTSGTTGVPKAVPNTHANHIWNINVCSTVWRWTAKDSLLISLPLSHWYGIVMGLSGALFHANTLYLQSWFDEKQTLEALASGRISFFTHISQAYLKLLEVDGDYNLSNVRLCVSGGAPLPPEVWKQFKKRFGIEILETYGSSETGRIAANAVGQPTTGSPGEVLPGVDLHLSKTGEVQIKSPGVFPGYFNNPKATAAAYTNDGYFRTGDIAEMKGGHIFLKGRAAEQIRRFGYSVSPRDVEWAMHQNPGVKDIFVMGRQNAGEPNDELVYFIVTDLTEEQIRQFCKGNLLFAWRPDRLVYMPELPRTRSGKPRVAEFRSLVA